MSQALPKIRIQAQNKRTRMYMQANKKHIVDLWKVCTGFCELVSATFQSKRTAWP